MLVLSLTVLVGGGQALAEPIPRTDIDWMDSGGDWSEINTVETDTDAVPYITYSRQLLQDPENRNWHVHTWWWTGAAWDFVEVVRSLNGNPHATAAARTDTGSVHDLVHAWRDGNGVQWQLFFPGSGEMDDPGNIEGFSAVNRGYPVGLAVRTDNDAPVFTFFADPIDGPPAMYYAPWDFGNDGIGNLVRLPPCRDAYTPLHLRTTNKFVAVCATDPVDPPGDQAQDIFLVYEDADPDVPDVDAVFGAGDDDQWELPDLALAGNDAVVAAVNHDTDEVWVRWQSGGVWQAAISLFDAGERVNALSVAARNQDGGIEIAVMAQTGNRVWYAEKLANGNVPTPRRVDLYPRSGASCDGVANTVDIWLPNDGEAWLNWQVVHTGGEEDVVLANRFTAFRRDDARDHIQDMDLFGQRPTALALTAEGDDWTCYYNEDLGGGGDYALYIKHRTGVPIQVDDDTSAPGDSFGRGCDVAVDGEGILHVVWGNETNDKLLYATWDGVVWDEQNLIDSTGVVPATAHLGLTVAPDGTSAVVYQRPIGGNLRACVLDSPDQATWTTTCFNENDGGWYPYITNYTGSGGSNEPYALVYGVGGTIPSAIRVAITTGTPGGWTSELVINEYSFDYSIAARKQGSEGELVVSWARADGTPGIRWARRTGVGAWTAATLESGAMEFTNVKLDAALKPVFTWKKNATEKLRIGTWDRYANGRYLGQLTPVVIPADPLPTGRFLLCDIDDNYWGTSLELDGHDNPRIMHRALGEKTLPTHIIQYTTRP